jgi:hypothetical protein
MDPGYDGLQRINWVNSEDYDAAYMNSLVKIVDSQVHGALEGVGNDVIDGGVVAAGSGLSVAVTALKAVCSTQHGQCYLQTDTGETVDSLPAEATVYIHAAAVFAAGPREDDSRENAGVVLFWSYLDSENDAVLLATVETGAAAVDTVTDSRTLVPAQQALALCTSLVDDIADLQDLIDDLTARVEVLEGMGGGETTRWGALEKTGADPTRISQEIDADVAQHVTDYHSGDEGGEVPLTLNIEEWEVDAANHAQMALYLTSLDADLPLEFQDAVTVVHGVYGDGTDGTPDWVDEANSTWL